jgi:hypothetical protein
MLSDLPYVPHKDYLFCRPNVSIISEINEVIFPKKVYNPELPPGGECDVLILLHNHR